MQGILERAKSVVDSVASRLPALSPDLLAEAKNYAGLAAAQAQPYVAAAAAELRPLVERVTEEVRPHVTRARALVNEQLAGLDSATVALMTAALLLVLYAAARLVIRVLRPVAERGLRAAAFDAIRSVPFVRAILAREKEKAKAKILAGRAAHGFERLTVLPRQSTPAADVMVLLRQRAAADAQLDVDGQSRLSGAVYMEAGGEHRALLDDAHRLFSLTNPLHADAFPSVRQMEAEVVAMTAGLLGGGPGGRPDVCGAMTSGGTESILSAVKASRDFVAATRGVRQPEMIIGASAHAAYWKAAEYFKIKLWVVPVGRDFRLSPAAVRRRLGRNTVLLVASAPGFPHGLVDDVAGIARLAARAGACCHVDACLGGFCLPFVRRLGGRVPAFDFGVPGVTSMSVDTHKFGLAHKGTSVVLYSSPQLRAHQYTSITEWSGGLYISPGLAGSRPGALIASAWAALVHCGEEGLLAATAKIMAARDTLVEGIGAQVPELEVIGDPEMAVVAFRARRPAALNIYILNNLLTARGWHLNALQSPPALHFCFTAMNAGAAPALVAALRACTDEAAALAADPARARAAAAAGSAPVYGMANVSPDRGMLGEFLVAYQDVMLMP